MNAHVSNIARTCYFELRRLASIRRFLTSTATASQLSGYVLSRIYMYIMYVYIYIYDIHIYIYIMHIMYNAVYNACILNVVCCLI